MTPKDIKNGKRFLFFKKYPQFKDVNLIFYPMWIILIEAWADRPPFKPKRMEFVGYIDPFIKDSGLINSIPIIKKINVKKEYVISPPSYEFNDSLISLEKKILKVDIRKQFALKTPSLNIISRKLAFLPCWKGTIKKEVHAQESIVVINGLNGILEHRICKALLTL